MGVRQVGANIAPRPRQTAAPPFSGLRPPEDARLREQGPDAEDGLPCSDEHDRGELSRDAVAHRRAQSGESDSKKASWVLGTSDTTAALARTSAPVYAAADTCDERAGAARALDLAPLALTFEIAPMSALRLRRLSNAASVFAMNVTA